MKKVTVIYHKDDDFTDLTIRINGKKFSEDKTEYISNLPIESWFQPSNDPYFEWSGFVQEIECATNSTMNEIRFEFFGADCDKTYFLNKIQQTCSYKHTDEKNANVQKINIELQVESILTQARLDYDAERYTAAFRGFESIATESVEAKFYLAEMYFLGDHVEVDNDKAFELYTECYNSNFQTATYRLAQCYYYGWGCETDYKKSKLYAEEAFKLDDNYSNVAHYIYGCCAFYTDNFDEAIQHLKVSTDAEYRGYFELGLAYKQIKKFTDAFKTFKKGINYESKCYAQLALCYAEGRGTKQDNYRAFQMMEKGAEDDIKAKMGLVGYYIQGIGTAQNLEKGAEILSELNEELPEDEDISYLNGLFLLATEQHEEAISFFQQAIEEGNYEAKIALGDCYIKLNQFQAAEEVLLSALNDFPNNSEVYKSLGDLYFDVDSPLKNNRKALKNYEKAVSLESTDAMYALFSYYVEIKDEEKAMDYLSRATKGGHIEATLLSGILAYEQNDIEEAIKLLTVCAELGLSPAQYYLGRCYWAKDTKFTDRNEGISWLIQAANNGSGEACFNLSVIYESDDIFKDPQKAFEYELKGHELGDVDCSYWLARDYLLNENYINPTEGIEIFRQLGKQGIAKAKYFLAQYYYEKYQNIVRKIGIFDAEEESVLMTLSKCVPYVNFVTTPFSWLKKNIRQITREKDLTESDYANIDEMIKLFTQLKDNPCDLKDDQIKSVKKRLRSIKDKYLRR